MAFPDDSMSFFRTLGQRLGDFAYRPAEGPSQADLDREEAERAARVNAENQAMPGGSPLAAPFAEAYRGFTGAPENPMRPFRGSGDVALGGTAPSAHAAPSAIEQAAAAQTPAPRGIESASHYDMRQDGGIADAAREPASRPALEWGFEREIGNHTRPESNSFVQDRNASRSAQSFEDNTSHGGGGLYMPKESDVAYLPDSVYEEAGKRAGLSMNRELAADPFALQRLQGKYAIETAAAPNFARASAEAGQEKGRRDSFEAEAAPLYQGYIDARRQLEASGNRVALDRLEQDFAMRESALRDKYNIGAKLGSALAAEHRND